MYMYMYTIYLYLTDAGLNIVFCFVSDVIGVCTACPDVQSIVTKTTNRKVNTPENRMIFMFL